MSRDLQLSIISNALIDLGHAPLAAELNKKLTANKHSPKAVLLANIQEYIKVDRYERIADLVHASKALSANEKSTANYLVLRFTFLRLLVQIQQRTGNVKIEDAEAFLITKLIPALKKIENVSAVSYLSSLAEPDDVALSKLIDSAATQGSDASVIFNSKIMLVPITEQSFQESLSPFERLNSIFAYHLPAALGLWEVNAIQNHTNASNRIALDDILTDALMYRVTRSLYYLPDRMDPNPELSMLTNFNGIQDKNESNFPIQNLYTLSDHKDQVWFVKFSPSGRYLATGSLDDTCIIYDVADNFRNIAVLSSTPEMEEAAFVHLSFKPALDKKKGVIYISWEPHERFLVVCCLDTVIRVWNIESLTLDKRLTRSMDDTQPRLVTCFTLGQGMRSWPCEFLNSELERTPRFIVGSPDKVLKAFTVDGVELLDFYSDTEEWQKALEEETSSIIKDENGNSNENASEFNRVNDLAISPNGKLLVSANNDMQVFFYEIPDLTNPSAITSKIGLLSLSGKLTSCNLSASGKYMLLSIAPEQLQVWDISPLEKGEKPFLKSKLLGLSQAKFMVRSCFGYLPHSNQTEELVLSGSDDGFIYIWRLETGQLITRVRGHESLCNCVDWNRFYVPPRNGIDYGAYWCSVGDDKLVQIWGPKPK